jgi:NitT/TauT family transport system permease protein
LIIAPELVEMATTTRLIEARPNYERTTGAVGQTVNVEQSLALGQRLWKFAIVRKLFLLAVIAAIWQIYAAYVGNELMFPTFGATVKALWDAFVSGPLLERTLSSLRVLLMGYGIGIAIAGALLCASVLTRLGSDLLSLLTAMFNPLPAIALLPLAMLWFGLGQASITFVTVHSVLWAVALNAYSGFQSVSETTRMAGQSFGLTGLRYILGILVPAAFPSILSGLKIGWAFAWRTLIAAELVFGASSRSGGLGWFIFESRNSLETPSVFAGLLLVIALGLFVDGVVFRIIEKHTVRRWGMQA